MISDAQTVTADRPVALFVLGMHRSGTSALTRVLSLCGGTLPRALLGAMSDNPLGRWEPRKANYLNDAILRRNGSAEYDPSMRLQEEGGLGAEEKAACIAEIREFFATLPRAPLVVIKDPKISLLCEVWFEAARLAGFDISVVIAVRHPQEVIASVAARIGASPAFSSAWWLKSNLLAERHTRALPRVFVEYANLLDDWRREVKRISAALPIDIEAQDEEAIEEFLKPDLRHERQCGPLAEPFGGGWVSTVYGALHLAARDEPWDRSALDRVFEAYRAGERGFRTTFDEYHRFRKFNRLIRPSIMKWVFELLAIAHRRKGTWA